LRTTGQMYPFAAYVLRKYHELTGWNEDFYSKLTRSSTAILDFEVPHGVNFAISKSPTPLFKTTYTLQALPTLHGSLGYIFTSCPLDVGGSHVVPFDELLPRFKIYGPPKRPEGKEEEYLAGQRVDTRDYLLYGRMYVPAQRIEALYSVHISPTLQGTIAAISEPGRFGTRPQRYGAPATRSNLMFGLEHDIGRWCTEYSYSAEDGMWGARVLHHFGRLAGEAGSEKRELGEGEKRVDEEDPMPGGLRGRFSAGAEAYFSAKEKSAGVSTGIRFTTLPDATPPSLTQTHPPVLTSSSQPPTTITATFNPIMGQFSGAYAARVSRDLTLCSRYDFNMYSYESDWTMGAEWWVRKSKVRPLAPVQASQESPVMALPSPAVEVEEDEIQGVVKARVGTDASVSLMWEGRLRNTLISLGVLSNLASPAKPIVNIGVELAYFSSDE